MLRILLAQAEVELPPDDIAGHPMIRKHAKALGKKPSQVLLDQNHHQAAIRYLDDAKRRGRPDIAQTCLLVLLESPLAKAGGVEVAMHTRGGHLVRIRTDTRLPRGEARFQGLLAKVLGEGRSQAKDPLLWVEDVCDEAQALALFGKGPVLRLDEGGGVLSPEALCGKADGGDLTLVLGAYPAGDWSDGWQKAAPETVSIWPDPLNAWAVAAEVVAAWRAKHGPAAGERRGA